MMNRSTVILVVLFCLLAISHGIAQQAESSATEAPAEAPEIKPIPAAQIVDRGLETAALLRDAEKNSDVNKDVQGIQDDFPAKQKQIEELQKETLRQRKTGGPVSIIEETENEWSRVEDRLHGWLQTLASRAESLGSMLEKVQAEKALWALTRDSAVAETLPQSLKQEVRDTLASIDSVERRLRSAMDSTLDLQVSVAKTKALANEVLADQREAIAERKRGLLGVDSLPLWKAFGTPDVDGTVSEQVTATRHRNYEAVRKFVTEKRATLLLYLLSLTILVAGLVFLRVKARVWVQQDKSLQLTVNLLERPVAAGVIIVGIVHALIELDAPTAWTAILAFLIVLALLRLLPQMLATSTRSWSYLLIVLLVLQQAVKLTPDGNVLNRVALLLLSLSGITASVWLDRTMGARRSDISQPWLPVMRLGVRIAAVLLVIGSAANVVGSVGFATLVITGTLRAAAAAVILWVVAVLLRSVVRVSMLVQPVRSFGIVSQRGDITRRTLFRAITVLAVVGWVVATLSGFLAFDAVVGGLSALIMTPISLGKFTVTPGDVLLFVLVIWLSFKISRLLCFVLDADVLPHMRLPRGVPGAVSRLTHYSVIVIGVMIAVAAAGFPLDKITIIFGALGVGIGFGLQGVVNNFVSGLILLFERPIQVGDRIQLATVEGIVEEIGMRASTVRSVQGAEIIVPNANLISAEVVNWTLHDMRRRLEIPVGVAYGTDPGSVIDILVDVATKHPEVADNPKPDGLFLDFGESSLDFQLRAWTAANQHTRVSSELRVAMTQALKEAGIEIPFPQRDLHLRSIDDGVAFAAGRADKDSERR